jgi:hypothetical protein
VSLAKDNLKGARATRNKIRESTFGEVEMEEDRAPLTPRRGSKKIEVLIIRNIVL